VQLLGAAYAGVYGWLFWRSWDDIVRFGMMWAYILMMISFGADVLGSIAGIVSVMKTVGDSVSNSTGILVIIHCYTTPSAS
jgi:hypothetical protein